MAPSAIFLCADDGLDCHSFSFSDAVGQLRAKVYRQSDIIFYYHRARLCCHLLRHL